jgi:hypothetical protein
VKEEDESISEDGNVAWDVILRVVAVATTFGHWSKRHVAAFIMIVKRQKQAAR